MPFSVGDGAAALGDVVVVVVVEVVEGACSPLLPHPAANAVNAISAQPLATAIRRRLIRPVITIRVPFMLSGSRFELVPQSTYYFLRCTPGGSVGAGGARI